MAKIKDAKKANFELKKLKVKDGKVVSTYLYKHDENPDSETRTYPGVKIPLQPHPDLISLYNQLREYVLRDFYIEPTTENLAQLTITSINLSGEDEKLGVIICSEFETLHNSKVALNTGNIILSNGDTGLEAEINVIVDAIIDEAFQYLFKGKRQDPTLFGNDEESESNGDKSGLNNKLQKVS